MLVTVDGGLDENPRYTKTIECAIDYFLSQDIINRVEHQMVEFSQELSGGVLLHDNFGPHLNVKGETIDKELEKRNFRYAGEILAKI